MLFGQLRRLSLFYSCLSGLCGRAPTEGRSACPVFPMECFIQLYNSLGSPFFLIIVFHGGKLLAEITKSTLFQTLLPLFESRFI
jgi:hypothetical protein